MKWKTAYAAALCAILMITVLNAAASPPPSEFKQPPLDPADKAERILWVADSAENATERLINQVTANETAMRIIEEAGLIDEFNGNISRFQEGVAILEAAHSYFSSGDYENATANAIESLSIFREVFRSINKILCTAKIKSREVFEGQGLIIAMELALKRVERLEELAKALEAKGLNVSDVFNVLNEAKQYLNIDEAKELLQQGNVSTVVRRLVEANRLIAKASWMLNEKNRELIAERVKQYLERLRIRIRERLRAVNMTEEGFFKCWNFTSPEEFWRQHLEIAERIRSRLENRMFNETTLSLNELGRKINEFRWEFEESVQKRGDSGFGHGPGGRQGP